MLIPGSVYGRSGSVSRRLVRVATGGIVLMTGFAVGLGGLLVQTLMSGMSLQQRTQASNFRINRALDQLSMVGIAHADVPASCGTGGSCGSCGCGE